MIHWLKNNDALGTANRGMVIGTLARPLLTTLPGSRG